MILKYRVDFRQMKKKLISENKLEFDKIVKAKNLYIMMKKIKKMKFISKSLQNSQMNWDNVGTGEVVVSVDNNKIYFFEEIHLENGMKLNDKKMWEIDSEKNKIGFYHFRNNDYENIFNFILENGKYITERKYEFFPDNYFGEIEVFDDKIHFTIKIVGSKKNEIIEYIYEK